MNNNLSVIEALILASPEPIATKKITEVLEDMKPKEVAEAVDELNHKYSEQESSFRIRNIAGGFQFYIIPEYTGFVQELFARRRKLRLTRAALEVMAIIAYRQPVTKIEIEQIRGVASDGVVHNLLEKKLITITGRAESVGRPLQYGTTAEFLKFFGLNKINDLPKMSEIEELIKASEPANQTELNLKDEDYDNMAMKLNIADGTYDPDEQKIECDISLEKSELIETENELNIEELNKETEEDFEKNIISENSSATSDEPEENSEKESVIVDIDAS
ncbi:MAG: SMC-Scp complex subunit ScpB [candidate division Zixibacteria bacterium]|nr:SMC-Scp complex subunit ScpB [candidate division Zixibacteria bacterium]